MKKFEEFANSYPNGKSAPINYSTNPEHIKPIQTDYNGYHFRSRLEARWAVFWDALGIEYQYEPEGFHGHNGIRYLPDFYFPAYHVYAEVKATNEYLFSIQEKISAAIDFQSTPVSNGLLLLGQIPYPEQQHFNYDIRGYYLHWNEGVVCSEFAIQSLHECGRILLMNKDIDYSSYPLIPQSSSIEVKINNYGDKHFSLLDSALKAARSARFEFDEKESKKEDQTTSPF